MGGDTPGRIYSRGLGVRLLSNGVEKTPMMVCVCTRSHTCVCRDSETNTIDGINEVECSQSRNLMKQIHGFLVLLLQLSRRLETVEK